MPKKKPEKTTNPPKGTFEGVSELLSGVDDDSDKRGDLDSGEEDMLNEGIDPTIDCYESVISIPTPKKTARTQRPPAFDPNQPSTSSGPTLSPQIEEPQPSSSSAIPRRQSSRIRRRTQLLIKQTSESDDDLDTRQPFRKPRYVRLPGSRRSQVNSSPTTDSSSSDDQLDWKSEDVEDDGPQPKPPFTPGRTPGTQLPAIHNYTPGQLFKLSFSTNVMRDIAKNTNKQGQKMKAAGKKYNWKETTIQELYHFIAVIVFMGLVSVPTLKEYWAEDGFFGQPFAKRIMSRCRFMPILWNLHLSDPDEDAGKPAT